MEQAYPSRPLDTRQFRSSWRLTFRFDGKRVELVRQQRLQKIAPGTTGDDPEPGKSSGAWLSILDGSGRPLFHRLLNDPFATRAEHHSPDGRITVHSRRPEPREFTTIVPDIPGAVECVLYSSPTEPDRIFEPARELGRYKLAERQE